MRLLPILLLLTACTATPTRWHKPGVADAGRDEAECRAAARQEAARRLPYGDGPPIFPRNVSMLQWTMAIDDERAYLAETLTRACLRERGFEPVSMPVR